MGDDSGKGKLTGFWILTGLIIFSHGASGIMDWMGAAPVADGIAALGYPSYFLYILGTWKILGVIALAAPGALKVKEWAYAGFFFDFSGAVASHLLAGEGVGAAAPAGVLLCILLGSYALRPEGR